MKSTQSPKRIVPGLIFITIGILLILNNMGLLPHFVSNILLAWPMIFVAIGLISLENREYNTATIMFLFGAVFMLPRVMELPENFWRDFWPLVFVVIGFLMLLKRKKSPHKLSSEKIDSSGDVFEHTTIFCESNNTFSGQEITSAQVSTIFGNATLDLTNAKPISNIVSVNLTCVFGGMKIYVPKEWTINNNLITLLSGVSEKQYSSGQATQDITVKINGKALFSGIEIVKV